MFLGPNTNLFCSLEPMTHTRAKLSQLVAVPILPLPAVTGYYLSPRHETFIFRPFTGETRRTPRAFATFRFDLFTTFFTAQMGRGKIQWGAFTSYATTRLCCKEFRFVNSDSEQATVLGSMLVMHTGTAAFSSCGELFVRAAFSRNVVCRPCRQ